MNGKRPVRGEGTGITGRWDPPEQGCVTGGSVVLGAGRGRELSGVISMPSEVSPGGKAAGHLAQIRPTRMPC